MNNEMKSGGPELCVHHVGGRGVLGRFPSCPGFERDILTVLYEADASCIGAIERDARAGGSKCIVVPACLAGEVRQASYYEYGNPTANSMLSFAPTFLDGYRYFTEDVFEQGPRTTEVLRVSQLSTTTLDVLAGSPSVLPPPDYLSLNTQGSELDILRGATNGLRRNCLVVHTEVSLVDVYQGQAQFGEFRDFLAPLGFRLGHLIPHGQRSHAFRLDGQHVRAPIGCRGPGSVMQADIRFFKEPGAILRDHDSPALGLRKAIFLGFIHNYFEYAFACLEALRGNVAALEPEGNPALQYEAFVAEFAESAIRYRAVFPLEWTALFEEGATVRRSPEACRALYFTTVSGDAFRDALPQLISEDHVGIEEVAVRFGLMESADVLRYHRLAMIYGLLRATGLATPTGDGGALVVWDAVRRL